MILHRTRNFWICAFAILFNLQLASASELQMLKKYLASLNSVSMDFVQIDSRENFAEGKLVIQKPYKFRCNYYEPYPLLIIGNKSELAIYDYELEQASRIKRKDNMFNFLLEESEKLDNFFELENVIDNPDTRLYKFNHRESGRIVSLAMQKKPYILQQIIIDEPDGNIIELKISNIKQINISTKKLFSIPDPKIFGPPKRMSKDDIEKILIEK